MEQLKLEDINFYHIGSSIQIAGIIWSGDNQDFITVLPNKETEFPNLKVMPLTLEEWEKLMRQVDVLEVEMFAQDPTGLTKVIVRKSQRQIDNRMQWAVFKRDNYTCRYCGRDGIPLTVDHVITWEEGGPTIIDNLVTACRSCNSDRGTIPYIEWIKSHAYRKRSEGLPYAIKHLNEIELVDKLPELEKLKVNNIRSR